MVEVSMTKRYFTSDLTVRSYASFTCRFSTARRECVLLFTCVCGGARVQVCMRACPLRAAVPARPPLRACVCVRVCVCVCECVSVCVCVCECAITWSALIFSTSHTML
jgi:hypothetical protein